jgi:hypothetical protein
VRVKGRKAEVAPEDYAREVADVLAERLVEQLSRVEGIPDVLPEPDEFADSLGPLVLHVPDESPNELADLVGPFWTSARTREALGVSSRQALDSRRRTGSVLGVKSTDGDRFYPVSQFHKRADGGIEVKPALVPFLRTLRGFDAWTVAVLLHTPAPELADLTPLDWVRHGKDPKALEDLARAVAREWSAGAA